MMDQIAGAIEISVVGVELEQELPLRHKSLCPMQKIHEDLVGSDG